MQEFKIELPDDMFVVVTILLVIGSILLPFLAAGAPDTTINWRNV